jgi:hypothetical protein
MVDIWRLSRFATSGRANGELPCRDQKLLYMPHYRCMRRVTVVRDARAEAKNARAA